MGFDHARTLRACHPGEADGDVIRAAPTRRPLIGYLALSHAGTDVHPDLMARISAIYQRANSPFVPRSHADITRFFGDFVLEPPGLVTMWPYAEPPATEDPEVAGTGYSGVGRKPERPVSHRI